MVDNNATSTNARHGGDRRFEPMEPELLATALSVPETDPERIAFNLWNEGRVDEAVEYLEREIANRRENQDDEPHAGSELITIEPSAVEPVSDWRERHRTALPPAEFNALGAPIRTIDLVARPADAIMPHPPRRRFGRAWIMGLALVAIGVSASALMWSGRDGAPDEMVAPVLQATAEVEPVTIVPPDAKPETEVASADAGSNVTPAAVTPDEPPADVNVAAAPPPDELPPEDVAPDAAAEPQTTASITPAPVAEEPAPIVEARLPRLRPEPPADAPRTVAAANPSPPVIYAPAPPPGYAPGPPPVFDPMNPRPTLTPAEYQALLERRAWAQDYVSRRRAYAERRALEDEEPPLLGRRGPIVRIFRN